MGLVDKVKSALCNRKHVVESTALCLVSNPIYAASETFIANLSNMESVSTRAVVLGLTYAGFGKGYMVGMMHTRRKLHAENPGVKQKIVDAGFGLVWAGLTCPPLYFVTSGGDLKKTVYGSLMGMVLGVTAGGPIGMGTNVISSLMGTGDEHTEKALPRALHEAQPKMRLFAAAGISAVLLAGNAAVYAINTEQTIPAATTITVQDTVRTQLNSQNANQKYTITYR